MSVRFSAERTASLGRRRRGRFRKRRRDEKEDGGLFCIQWLWDVKTGQFGRTVGISGFGHPCSRIRAELVKLEVKCERGQLGDIGLAFAATLASEVDDGLWHEVFHPQSRLVEQTFSAALLHPPLGTYDQTAS